MAAQLTSEQISAAKSINLIQWLIDQGHGTRSHHTDKGLFCSPFRDDSTPSLSISEKNGIYLWHDFGTQEGGDAIDFVQRYHSQTFPEAVRTLLDYQPGASTRTITPLPAPKKYSSRNLTHWHKTAWSQMEPSTLDTIQRYFTEHNLPWIPETQPIRIWLSEQPYNPQSKRIPFLAWPTPNPFNIQAFECRAMVQTHPDHARRSFPTKTLWIHHRQNQPVLITESIRDCLAGERLFTLPFTHIALNGIEQWPLIEATIHALQPPVIFLALDHDTQKPLSGKNKPHHLTGQITQQHLLEVLTTTQIPICQVQVHHRAGVKDLLRFLSQHPQTLPTSTLSETGIWANVCHPNNPVMQQTSSPIHRNLTT